MSGWPDPDKPGYPENYEVDGFHWLFDPETKKSFPEIWVAEIGAWAVGDAWTPRMVAEIDLHYQGPVLTPAEVDGLEAELTHWREVCYAHEAELQWLRAENEPSKNEAALMEWVGRAIWHHGDGKDDAEAAIAGGEAMDDTHGGIFWVRADDGSLVPATPGEACDEVKRLRAENARLRGIITDMALSDLAEMDADLLDQPTPGVKP
jgi:hypothetical protein